MQAVDGLNRPVNVLAGMTGFTLDVASLGAIGVKRIRVGRALFGVAKRSVERVARESRERGVFVSGGKDDA